MTCYTLQGLERILRGVSLRLTFLQYSVWLARKKALSKYFIRSKINAMKHKDAKCWSSADVEAAKKMFEHTASASSITILAEAQQAEPRYTTSHRKSWSANPHSSLLCWLSGGGKSHTAEKQSEQLDIQLPQSDFPELFSQSHQPSTVNCCLQHRHALTQEIILPSIKLAVVQHAWKTCKGDLD